MSRSDDEGFLARWSRRKSIAVDEQDASPADRPGEAGAPNDKPPPEIKPDPEASAPANEVPFDISSLPPLESIGAETDLTPFFRSGVPSEIKHAALRRVWVTDPAIRDFVGLQEYDWDFVNGDIPGFGPIGPDVDVRAMAEQLFGGGKQAAQAPGSRPPAEIEAQAEAQAVSPDRLHVAQRDDSTISAGEPAGVRDESVQDSVLVQRDDDGASQNRESETRGRELGPSQQPDASENSTVPVRARRHGSALPS